MRTQAKLLPGDRVWFRSNGVRGVVVTNHGPAVNTETGNDVITWADGADSVCVHDSSKLTTVDPSEKGE